MGSEGQTLTLRAAGRLVVTLRGAAQPIGSLETG